MNEAKINNIETVAVAAELGAVGLCSVWLILASFKINVLYFRKYTLFVGTWALRRAKTNDETVKSIQSDKLFRIWTYPTP